jgi:hypothetical protein
MCRTTAHGRSHYLVTQTSCTLVRRQADGMLELPTDAGQNTNPVIALGGKPKLLLTTLGKVDTDL